MQTREHGAQPLVAEAWELTTKSLKQHAHHTYGENGAMGTSVLLLSSIPIGKFGCRTNLPQEPLPVPTVEVLKHIPENAEKKGAESKKSKK